MNSEHDQIVQKYFEAAGELVRHGLARVKIEEPSVYNEVSKQVAGGAILCLSVGFGKDAILATRLTIRMNGETVELLGLEAKTQLWN